MATWHFDENTADTLPAAIDVSSDPPPSEHEAFGPAAENQVQEEMAPNSLEEKANTGDDGKKGAGGGSGLNALTGWSSEPEAGGYAEDGTVDIRGNPVLKSKTGGWKACPFILGNECCERLAYYGIAINLVVYLQTKLHQEAATAANNVTNWSGTCYIAPLIGGFFADAFLGRYWTIASFSTIYFIGMLLLTLSASLPSLRPKHANENATSGELAVFYLALYLIALGTGGIKPCVSSFGADQFDDNDPKEKKRKTSFFNWFYFSINVGALIASSVLVWIQTNIGWGWGFGIPTVAMGLAIGTFFFGTPLYRHQKPGGSPLTRIIQVLFAAIRKWRVPVGKDHTTLYELQDHESGIEGSRTLEHTPAFQFLDKAATLTTSDKVKGVQPSPWQLCSITQVEEVKIIIRLLPIWASSIVFATVYAQMSTLFVEQGTVMNVSMGPNFNIPAASLSIFDTLSVLVCVPLYDRVLVPIVRRRTGNVRGFKQLHRMGIGLVVSTFSMVAAAIVEIERLKSAKRHNLLGTNAQEEPLPVPISIFWQIPQYFLIGASEVFTFIGQLEFFYDQAPDAMRSLSSALSLTTVALGNYLSTVIVTIVTRISTKNGKPGWIPNNLNRGHLDYFFWTLAVLSVLNIGFYLACAHWYKYKRVNASTVAPDPATKTTAVVDSQQQ